MKSVTSALCFGFVVLVMVTSLFNQSVHAETVGCGPEEVKRTSEYINGIVDSISKAVSSKQTNSALKLLKVFDNYPLSPDAAKARIMVAELLRSQKRFLEAADLLKKTIKDDPYNRVTPDSLTLLLNILYYDLKDANAYNSYLKLLAINYYPEIPSVAQARAAFGNNLSDTPKSRKILLDESLHESSIFNRSFLGSTNFCQWDVIRALSEGGFVVHDNGWLTNSKLTQSIMNQYGLVIMNCGTNNGAAIPNSTIEEIVNYVKDGGRLLVVCAGKGLGSGVMPRFYNPLVGKFGFQLQENSTTGDSTVNCKPANHPAMDGIALFRCTFGVRVDGGTPIGHYKSDPIISITDFDKGMVIVAGIGSGFQGNTIGDLYRITEAQIAEAKVNRTFILKLAQYLTSSIKN